MIDSMIEHVCDMLVYTLVLGVGIDMNSSMMIMVVMIVVNTLCG
jgi:hypothetical protein